MKGIERRLKRLEGRWPAGTVPYNNYSHRLIAFFEDTFERQPNEPWVEVSARCMGLPHSKAFREALAGRLSANAVVAVGQKHFGDDWQSSMVEIMRPMLEQCIAKHGNDGIVRLAMLLPIWRLSERLGLGN